MRPAWRTVLRMNTIVQSLPILLLISALAGIGAFFITKSLPPTYEVHFSYTISLSQREAEGEFRFDGFYALQATELFARTVAGWSRSPELIMRAHELAGLASPPVSLREVRKLVRAEQVAPQLVEVSVQHTKKEDAEKLARGLVAAVQQNVEIYEEEGIPALSFRVVATNSWTSTSTISVGVITISVFFLTFFLGANAVLLRTSIK